MDDDREYVFPAKFVAILPGLYAGQVYGWLVGIGIYLAAVIVLFGITFAMRVHDWPYRWVVRMRVAFILLAMAAIALSSAERISGA